MSRTYIAGKISGLDRKEAKDLFEDAEQVVRMGGHEPVSPIRLIQYKKDKKWEEYMKEAIALMTTCDRVLFLPNWSDSPGAKIEHALAKTLKMEISYLTHGRDEKPIIR